MKRTVRMAISRRRIRVVVRVEKKYVSRWASKREIE